MSQQPWIDPKGLNYVQNRVSHAHRDVEHRLAITLKKCDTSEK